MKAFAAQASTRSLGGPAARPSSPPKVRPSVPLYLCTSNGIAVASCALRARACASPPNAPCPFLKVYALTPRRPSEGGPPQKPYIPPYHNPYGDDEESDDELSLPVTERLALFIKALQSKHAEEGRISEDPGEVARRRGR